MEFLAGFIVKLIIGGLNVLLARKDLSDKVKLKLALEAKGAVNEGLKHLMSSDDISVRVRASQESWILGPALPPVGKD